MEDRNQNWWIAGLFLVYVLLAAVVPPMDDEVYYWCWSKELQWSYYDHPPMTAVLIRLSTSLVGDSVVGFRLPACIASAFVVWVINRLTHSRQLMIWVILTPLFSLGAVLITPDSPLIACWAAYLWWLVELHRHLQPAHADPPDSTLTTAGEPGVPNHIWILGGIILGCGVLSKYTMALAVPTSFITFIAARRSWKYWFPGYVLHGVIAFLVASPILIYNIHQNFEPLLFQWRHVAERPKNGLMSMGDFVGVQMLLFGTLPFTIWPWVCWNYHRFIHEPRLRVCACLYAIPLAFFVYKSTQSRLEGNWALICFISFWPVASVWYESVRQSKFWKWLTLSSFLPPILVIVVLVVHFFHPLSVVPVRGDRVHRQIALNTASRIVAEKIREQSESLPVYTDSYQMTALLRFQSLDVRQIDGLTRPSHFTRPPRQLMDVDRAYVVTQLPLPERFSAGFPPPELVASVRVEYRGEIDRTLNVWRYSK